MKGNEGKAIEMEIGRVSALHSVSPLRVEILFAECCFSANKVP